MMRNIFILRSPRSGKSTLAKMLKISLPDYSLISIDAVRNIFIKTIPYLNMDNRESLARKEIFPQFINEFINEKIITYY